MKAVVYKGPYEVAVEEVKDAEIEHPTDAVIDITTTCICGSDLHMYEGRTAAEEGIIFGHENMGIVSEVGEAVSTLEEGDRVVMPFNISCGFCQNCEEGYTGFCTNVNPGFAGSAYGYVAMGPYPGGQAEKLRVPYADHNALKLPEGREHEDAFSLLADIFPTGWHGTELANLQPGESVAVYGAGPVGLMAAYSAKIKGAAEIYVVDQVPSRLELAEDHCDATAIDFSEGDPVNQIIEEHGGMVDKGIDAVGYQATDPDAAVETENYASKEDISNRISHYYELYTKSILDRESLSAHEKTQLTKLERGFKRGEVTEKHIEQFATHLADAYAAEIKLTVSGPASEQHYNKIKSIIKESFSNQTTNQYTDVSQKSSTYTPAKENPGVVINNLIRVVRPTGQLGIPGLYVPEDPGAPDDMAAQGRLGIDFGKFFEKGLKCGTGQCNVKSYNRYLRDMIIEGRADPSWVVSHRVSLEEAPEMYEAFDAREEGVTKVLLEP